MGAGASIGGLRRRPPGRRRWARRGDLPKTQLEVRCEVDLSGFEDVVIAAYSDGEDDDLEEQIVPRQSAQQTQSAGNVNGPEVQLASQWAPAVASIPAPRGSASAKYAREQHKLEAGKSARWIDAFRRCATHGDRASSARNAGGAQFERTGESAGLMKFSAGCAKHERLGTQKSVRAGERELLFARKLDVFHRNESQLRVLLRKALRFECAVGEALELGAELGSYFATFFLAQPRGQRGGAAASASST